MKKLVMMLVYLSLTSLLFGADGDLATPESRPSITRVVITSVQFVYATEWKVIITGDKYYPLPEGGYAKDPDRSFTVELAGSELVSFVNIAPTGVLCPEATLRYAVKKAVTLTLRVKGIIGAGDIIAFA